jgi:hypothetical protein
MDRIDGAACLVRVTPWDKAMGRQGGGVAAFPGVVVSPEFDIADELSFLVTLVRLETAAFDLVALVILRRGDGGAACIHDGAGRVFVEPVEPQEAQMLLFGDCGRVEYKERFRTLKGGGGVDPVAGRACPSDDIGRFHL